MRDVTRERAGGLMVRGGSDGDRIHLNGQLLHQVHHVGAGGGLGLGLGAGGGVGAVHRHGVGEAGNGDAGGPRR